MPVGTEWKYIVCKKSFQTKRTEIFISLLFYLHNLFILPGGALQNQQQVPQSKYAQLLGIDSAT